MHCNVEWSMIEQVLPSLVFYGDGGSLDASVEGVIDNAFGG